MGVFIIFKLRLKLFICASVIGSLGMLGPSFAGSNQSYPLLLRTFNFVAVISK